MDYLKDPDAIYRDSFAAIRDILDLDTIPPSMRSLVIRLVHACGRPEIVDNLTWRGDPVAGAAEALKARAPVIVDATMVAAGITKRYFAGANPVICTLNEEETSQIAEEYQTTRSSAAVDLWVPFMAGAVIAIGNAPTALFRLIELLQDPETPRPAAIFAFPVGFVGAAESKEALIAAELNIPYVTLTGREGGSAFAAAAINAVALGDLT